MANPQKEEGHIRIANTLWEAWCRLRVPGEAEQVLKSIVRQTWGYNKKSDMITLNKFVLMTGIRKSHIVRAIRLLIQMGVVTQKGNGNYEFVKNFDLWKPLPKKGTFPNKGTVIPLKGNASFPNKGTFTDEPITIKTKTLFKRHSAFTPPTVPEIQEYVKKHNLSIDPEAFFHHYEANGWVQGAGRKPIRKWQSCCHTWQRNTAKFGGGVPKETIAPETDKEKQAAIRREEARVKAIAGLK